MNKNEVAQRIGQSILKACAEFEKSNKPGSLVIPIKLPGKSNEPDWTWSISLEMPYFVQSFITKEGQAEYKPISMAEYYEWSK